MSRSTRRSLRASRATPSKRKSPTLVAELTADSRREVYPMNEQEALAAIHNLEDGARDREFTEPERDRWNELNAIVDQFRKRTERIRELAGNPRNTEAGASFDYHGYRPRVDESAPAHV